MVIEFKDVLPYPLRDAQHDKQSIWKNNFYINHGQKTLLNAASGKGKSTFTYLLFGLRNDYEGEIMLNGQNIREFSLDEWIKLRKEKLAVVFQDLQLFPNLSVKQNLLLKNNLTATFTEDEIYQFVERLGLKNKWEQKCDLLSMGQQQRIAIVRALLQPFEFLILDEPFSHLDNENAKIALQFINEICDKNKAGFILTSLGNDTDFQFDKTLYL